jgi:hypothetical protein
MVSCLQQRKHFETFHITLEFRFPEDGLQIGIVGEAHGRELSNPDTPSFSCMITAFDKIQDATWGGHAQVIDKKTFLFEVRILSLSLHYQCLGHNQ